LNPKHRRAGIPPLADSASSDHALEGSETKQVRRLTVTVRPAVVIPRSSSSFPRKRGPRPQLGSRFRGDDGRTAGMTKGIAVRGSADSLILARVLTAGGLWLVWGEASQDRVRQRLGDAEIAVVVMMQPVPGDKIREGFAIAQPTQHQRAA
jgi:hypothetical protein